MRRPIAAGAVPTDIDLGREARKVEGDDERWTSGLAKLFILPALLLIGIVYFRSPESASESISLKGVSLKGVRGGAGSLAPGPEVEGGAAGGGFGAAGGGTSGPAPGLPPALPKATMANATTTATMRCSSTRTYVSSAWEELWVSNVRGWQKSEDICREVDKSQQVQMEKYTWALCSSMTNDPSVCVLDDGAKKIFYDRNQHTFKVEQPSSVTVIEPPKAVVPDDPSIFSYFEVRGCDGLVTREYIEPLVSHLRHPLAKCQKPFYPGPKRPYLTVARSWLVPPPSISSEKKAYYFDAGATNWLARDLGSTSSGDSLGGSSLAYFTTVFLRHGIHFDVIEAWEGSTSEGDFYDTVPADYKDRTIYHNEWIATDQGDAAKPFVPTVIREKTNKDDYVVFKLDIDSKDVETKIVDHLLSDDNDDLEWIDEFIWEHHVDNYLMNPNWGETVDTTKDIRDSYEYFLRLRKLGVRAHSWV